MARKEVVPSLIRFGRRVQARIFGTPVPQEVEEEFSFHVEMRIREYLDEGMTLGEARAMAVRRFGDIDEVKAICRKLGNQRERKMKWTMWMRELGQDAYFALRQIRKSPVLAGTAILTLALGIGANTAVFTVVNGVLLSPLSFDEPQELVEVRTRYLPPSGFDIARFPISVPELLDYRQASESYEAIGIYTLGNRTLTEGSGEAIRVPTVFVDRGALEALGVEPALGRWFTTEEDAPGNSIGLIGHELWTTRFGSDPSIVGKTVDMSGVSFLITGVMPSGFAFPSVRYQIFENYGIDPANPGNRAGHGSYGIGRLKPGLSLQQVEAEGEAIAAAWAEDFEHNVAHFPIFERLSDNIIGTDVQRALFILMGAVAVVLLIASVNVANLLMARGESRQQEIAVRNSLGASRSRIVRQLLTESVTLAVLGALLGLVIGTAGLNALLGINPTALPRSELIGLDGGVLLYTAVVTVLTAVLFGMAPALQALRTPSSALSPSSKTTSTRGQRGFRRLLVTAEVGLSLVIVLAAGLIARSFDNITAIDPGVQVDGRAVFSVSLTGTRYPDNASALRYFDEVQTQLSALPGVRSVAAVTHLPLSGAGGRADSSIEGHEPAPGEPIISIQWTGVQPQYFSTFGIRPLAGRLLEASDAFGSEPVIVVSEDVVDEYFGGENPIGRRMAVLRDEPRWARIVGVVPRTRVSSLNGVVVPQVYYTVSQGMGAEAGEELVWSTRAMWIGVDTDVPVGGLMGPIRAAMREIDAELPLNGFGTMEEVFDRSVAQPALMTNLLGSFAIIALVLAAIGIYGVVSYSVSRRTREIGIRLALGARRRSVSVLMVREGVLPAVTGVVVGLLAGLATTGFLADLLYEVSHRDPVVFASLPIFLLVVAAVSSWLPAQRATRLAPTEALRHE